MNPAKSSGSQPELELLGSEPGGSMTSTAVTAAVTSPEPEYSMSANSSGVVYTCASGAVRSNTVGVSSSKVLKLNSCCVGR